MGNYWTHTHGFVMPTSFIYHYFGEHLQQKFPGDRNYSGPLQFCQRKDVHLISGEDSSEGAIVQCRERFKVTSADLSSKVSTDCLLNAISGGLPGLNSKSLSSTSVLPSLQCILQQNTMQREEILKLIKHVEMSSGNHTEFVDAAANGFSQISSSSARERKLQSEVIQLQQSIWILVEELQRQKTENVKLEKKVNALLNRRWKLFDTGAPHC